MLRSHNLYWVADKWEAFGLLIETYKHLTTESLEDNFTLLPLYAPQVSRVLHKVFLIVTASKISLVVFWAMTLHSLAGAYHIFGETDI